MDPWPFILVLGALAALGISWHDKRARGWIFLIMGVYVFGCAAAWHGVPYLSAWVAMSDALICVMIYRYGAYKWEIGLYRLFVVSFLFSVFELMGFIGWNALYIASLEAINWLALIVIGVTAAPQHWRYNEKSHHMGLAGRFNALVNFARQKRKSHPGASAPG